MNKVKEYDVCLAQPDGVGCRMFKFFSNVPREVYFQSFTNIDNESVDQILSNREDRNTIQVFFHNHLNINATAKALVIHRNTLNYRIERIKKITGLDLRHLCDAFVFHALMYKYSN